MSFQLISLSSGKQNSMDNSVILSVNFGKDGTERGRWISLSGFSRGCCQSSDLFPNRTLVKETASGIRLHSVQQMLNFSDAASANGAGRTASAATAG